jgi:hypothetical protein
MATTFTKTTRSFILRVESEGRVKQFWVQDIKTGERQCFQTWRALKDYLHGNKGRGLR